MCDTLVATGTATADGAVIFGKNSDRERDEAQVVELHPAAVHDDGAMLQVTRIAIPQARRVRPVLICRPYWMWGAEMGANDAGVVIGNEAVHSTRPPNRDPALLGMDLLRLGLERSGSAAEACHVIATLLKAHGQGGNCGHRHDHYYHNSFMVADAAEAFVLETVGREHVAERVQGVRTISNAYTLPAMRAHADTALEATGCGPARCARSAALLQADFGAITARHAMTVLRDHGPEAGADWHPQRTVGRTLCMHAGDTSRRGQSVGSMVSELRPGGAVHWVTGCSAPCTGIFKPLTFASGLPAAESLPVGQADGESRWWRHERLHRALLRGGSPVPPAWLATERDALEAGFILQTRGPVDQAVSQACWAAADAAERRWLQQRLGSPGPLDEAYAAAWQFNEECGLQLVPESRPTGDAVRTSVHP